MTKQDPFRLWLEFTDAVRSGDAPRPAVAAWFLDGADAWSMSTGEEPLTAFLGITRRKRLDFLQRRQRSILRRVIDSLEPNSTAWAQAGALLAALERYESRLWPGHRHLKRPDPSWSKLHTALFELQRQPLPVPRTQRGLFGLLKSAGMVFSVDDEASSSQMATSTHAGADKMSLTPKPHQNLDQLRESARKEFALSRELQAEFMDADSYVAWRVADSKGLVKQLNAAAIRK